MVRYFKNFDGDVLFSVGTGTGDVEITEAEYNALLDGIREKAALVNRICAGEIVIDAVPAEWREEIRRRVNERIEREREAEQQEITDEEFMDMLRGVL